MNQVQQSEMTAMAREQGKTGMDGIDVDARDGADADCQSGEGVGAAERLFEASLTELEATGMPAQSAQFIFEGRTATGG